MIATAPTDGVAPPQDLQDLYQICLRFRAVVAATPVRERHRSMGDFPYQSCGSTCELLGTYLYEQGYGRFEYRHGARPGIVSHAWLQQAGLIIDLTADQFGAPHAPVIVTRHSPWHAGFGRSEVYPINIVASDVGALHPLWPFYQALRARLSDVEVRAHVAARYTRDAVQVAAHGA